MSRTTIHRILRDDYYTGLVTRNGVTRPGRHERIVDHDTFERVQAVLDARRAAGEHSKERAVEAVAVLLTAGSAVPPGLRQPPRQARQLRQPISHTGRPLQ